MAAVCRVTGAVPALDTAFRTRIAATSVDSTRTFRRRTYWVPSLRRKVTLNVIR